MGPSISVKEEQLHWYWIEIEQCNIWANTTRQSNVLNKWQGKLHIIVYVTYLLLDFVMFCIKIYKHWITEGLPGSLWKGYVTFSNNNLLLQQGHLLKPLTPNDDYSGRTAPLTSKRWILYIYSTNIDTEYFKNGIYCPFFLLKVEFIL